MMISRISIFSTRADLTRKKMTSEGLLSGKRRFVSFPITDLQKTKRQMLTWASRVGIFCFLDNHGYPAGIDPEFECLLAVGAMDSFEATAGKAFSQLQEWTLDRGEWLFGHF